MAVTIDAFPDYVPPPRDKVIMTKPLTIYPYADPKRKITNFRYQDWLVLGRAPEILKMDNRESMYVVMEDYSVSLDVDGKLMVIVVPKGMTTDLVSVPKWARSIIGRVGPHLEACIVHDWLYVAWQIQDREPTKADWRWANKVLYAGMKAAKCSWASRVAIRIAMETPFLSWGVFKRRDLNLFMDLGE